MCFAAMMPATCVRRRCHANPVRLGGDAARPRTTRSGVWIEAQPGRGCMSSIPVSITLTVTGGMRDGHGCHRRAPGGRSSPLRGLFRPIAVYCLAASTARRRGPTVAPLWLAASPRLRGVRRGLRRGILTLGQPSTRSPAMGPRGSVQSSGIRSRQRLARLRLVGRNADFTCEKVPDLHEPGLRRLLPEPGEGALPGQWTRPVLRLIAQFMSPRCFVGNEGGGLIGSGWWCGRRSLCLADRRRRRAYVQRYSGARKTN